MFKRIVFGFTSGVFRASPRLIVMLVLVGRAPTYL